MIKPKNTCLFFLAALLWFNIASAKLIAHTDRQNINTGESFNLYIKSDNASNKTLDLTPLENNFFILGRSQNRRLLAINGKTTAITEWVITLSPKHIGKLVLPKIIVGNAQTPALQLTVKRGTKTANNHNNKSIFIETKLDEAKPYLNSQMLYTIRLFYLPGLLNGTLSEPQTSDMVIDKLGDDINYSVTRHKKHYQVVERRYVLFPQKLGKQTLEPIIFSGLMRFDNQSRNLFSLEEKQVRAISPPRVIHVEAIPGNKNLSLIPAKSLHLKESWSDSPKHAVVGEPITRTITLTAEGVLAKQLPAIALHTPDDMKSYPNKAVLHNTINQEGVAGKRTEKIAYIATTKGQFNIPAIRISWWNTKTRHIETTNLPAIHVNVAPAIGTNYAKVNTPPATTQAATPRPTKNNLWPYLAALLFLGWGVTVYLWIKQKRSKASQTPLQEPTNATPTQRQALQHLKKMCLQNDAKAAELALLDWARLIWPSEKIYSLLTLSKRIPNKSCAAAIAELENNLYAANSAPWQGDKLIQSLLSLGKEKKPRTKKSKGPLPSLY